MNFKKLITRKNLIPTLLILFSLPSIAQIKEPLQSSSAPNTLSFNVLPYVMSEDLKFNKLNPDNKYLKKGSFILYPDGIIIDKKTCTITIQQETYSFNEHIEASVFASHLNLSIFRHDNLYKKYSIPSNGELIVQFQTDFFTVKSLCEKLKPVNSYHQNKISR